MNLLEYIKQGGKCKSNAGHWFVLSGFDEGEEYPINGFLIINNKSYPYKWTENGIPHNLPYTHGLDLVPVIEVSSYKSVSKKLLSEYEFIDDFQDDIRYGG